MPSLLGEFHIVIPVAATFEAAEGEEAHVELTCGEARFASNLSYDSEPAQDDLARRIVDAAQSLARSGEAGQGGLERALAVFQEPEFRDRVAEAAYLADEYEFVLQEPLADSDLSRITPFADLHVKDRTQWRRVARDVLDLIKKELQANA